MAILKKIFGPRREEVWRQFCKEINGRYIEGKFPDKEIRVEIKQSEWTITLDSYCTDIYGGISAVPKFFTRIRAPFISKDGF